MSRPFIFITTHTVKDGRLEELSRLTEEFLEFVRTNEPRLVAIGAYLNDSRDQMTLVQVHPDAESMDFHLQVAADKIHQAFNIVDNDSVHVFGDPGPVARGLLDQISQAGVRVTLQPSRLGGFNRLAAA